MKDAQGVEVKDSRLARSAANAPGFLAVIAPDHGVGARIRF